MHDRHTLDSLRPRISLAESDHWDRALTGFNQQLSQGIRPGAPGALLTTAAILWFLVFCHIEARTPEEAWPLGGAAPGAPAWLHLTGGKEALGRWMSSSSPPDPIAEALAPIPLRPRCWGEPAELDRSPVPPAFIRLFGLSRASPGVDHAPYRDAAVEVARALYTDRPPLITMLSFVHFLRTMTPRFKRLLLDRDPRALLLLACWYGTARPLGVWWMARRAWLEGAAIGLYLERYWSEVDDIHTILASLRQCGPERESRVSREGGSSSPGVCLTGVLVENRM